MAIFTFSTRATRPVDTDMVERVKQHCEDNCLNFSAVVIKLLEQWEKDNVERPAKVHSNK